MWSSIVTLSAVLWHTNGWRWKKLAIISSCVFATCIFVSWTSSNAPPSLLSILSTKSPPKCYPCPETPVTDVLTTVQPGGDTAVHDGFGFTHGFIPTFFAFGAVFLRSQATFCKKSGIE